MRTRVAFLTLAGLALTGCSGRYNPFAGVRAFIAIAVLITEFVVAYDIVQSRRSVVVKVLWIAFVFLVPVIGILAYLILERK